MKLYHGTTLPVARRAMVEGLKPRREHKRSNWEKAQSHRDGVYLTDAYPLYFAVHAMEVAYYKMPEGDARHIGAVVEVETDRLHPFNLVPDEDVLEQTGRKHDGLPGNWSMRQRTAYYRAKLRDYCNGQGGWEKSLEAMGTCAYLDTVPAAAITRVAFVDNRVPHGAQLMFTALDASIMLANYRFMATKYRELTAKVFAGGAGIEIQEVNP